MKTPATLLFLVFVLAASTASAQSSPTGADGAIPITWTAPLDSVTGNANPTLCTGAVTLACLSSYTASFQPPVTGLGSTTVTVANNVTAYTWRPGGKLFCGSWSVSLIANWIDNLGHTSPSTAATTTVDEPCTVTTKPNPPTNLKAVLAP